MANDLDLSVLLEGGVSAWNSRRAGRPEEDLSGADLREVDLRGADFSGVNLQNVDMRGCDLSGTNLDGAFLLGAELSGAKFRDTIVRFAIMPSANLTGVDLSNKSLRGALFSYTNLTGANLSDTDLTQANLDRARLTGAKINGSRCFAANFEDADLSGAALSRSVLMGASLKGANLTGANVVGTILTGADLTDADLTDADLTMASLVASTVEGAVFSRAKVYGLAAWDLRGTPRDQSDLVITPHSQADVTVDNLSIAEFVYLLLNNENVRNVIDSLTSKVVLILGRFSTERKPVLDALRRELRNFDRTPIVFDFSKPTSRGYAETVTLLARLARYVIADLTDAAEIRSELIQIVPTMPRLPIKPILLSGASEYATYVTDIKPYPWVLPIYEYDSIEHLAEDLREAVVEPLEVRWKQLTD